METFDATIGRVLFHKPSQWNRSGIPYLIATTDSGTTIKGEMLSPVQGQPYRLFGQWVPQKPPRVGQAFEFKEFEPIIEASRDGVAGYLARNVAGIGAVKALAIVETLGLDCLDQLRRAAEAEQVGELLAGLPSLSAATIKALAEHFASDDACLAGTRARLAEMFSDFRMPRSLIKRLTKLWGANAPEVIASNPYLLLHFRGIGWKTTDAFGLSIGYAAGGIERHCAAIEEALDTLACDGHTYGYRAEIEVIASKLLDMAVNPDAWDRVIEPAPRTGVVRVVRDQAQYGETYGLAPLVEAERQIARLLPILAEQARPLGFAISTEGLADEQAAAVRLIERHGVACLAGAPGTGKSYTISRVIASLIANGVQAIHVAAPTGKAAKRAAELLAQAGITGVPCTTIHRLLAPMPAAMAEPGVAGKDSKNVNRGDGEEFAFGYNASNPVPVEYLVLDEMSMCDAKLTARLLEAVAPGTRVVFVGDPNQLPSVGPGAVFRDMLESLPATFLREIRRSRPGRVIQACHAILDGRIPEPAPRVDLEAGENWVHWELDDPHQMAAVITDLHKPSNRFPDVLWDYQVVTPQKEKLPIACRNLNELLSAKLNPRPDGEGPEEGDGPTPEFRVGDKVVRTSNGVVKAMVDLGAPEAFDWSTGEYNREKADRPTPDWTWNGHEWKLEDCPVVNGDMGTVLDVVDTPHGHYAVVQFTAPDRLCRLPYGKCDLIAAYALTCHKAQGSGFPFVIVPVHDSFYWDAREQKGLFSREWLYTAISRAEVLLVTVGQFAAIEAAVGRKTVHQRRTRLAELLRAQSATALPVGDAETVPAMSLDTFVSEVA